MIIVLKCLSNVEILLRIFRPILSKVSIIFCTRKNVIVRCLFMHFHDMDKEKRIAGL